MDKQLAFILIGFFAICNGFITWAAFRGQKRNRICKSVAYGYSVLSWICVIAMAIMTVIYYL